MKNITIFCLKATAKDDFTRGVLALPLHTGNACYRREGDVILASVDESVFHAVVTSLLVEGIRTEFTKETA